MNDTSERRRADHSGDRLAATTIVSVGHRATLRRFHARRFVVRPNGSGPAAVVDGGT